MAQKLLHMGATQADRANDATNGRVGEAKRDSVQQPVGAQARLRVTVVKDTLDDHEVTRACQRHAVLGDMGSVLVRVERDDDFM
jgi:hypothetical protein